MWGGCNWERALHGVLVLSWPTGRMDELSERLINREWGITVTERKRRDCSCVAE